MKTVPNRICQVEVVGEWQDPQNGLDYDFSAKVIVSRAGEVEAVEFLSVDVYDQELPLDSDTAYCLYTNKTISDRLKDIAGIKALEKFQCADFTQECERE